MKTREGKKGQFRKSKNTRRNTATKLCKLCIFIFKLRNCRGMWLLFQIDFSLPTSLTAYLNIGTFENIATDTFCCYLLNTWQVLDT